MKKIVLFVAFVALFCGSFVACASKKEQSAPVVAAEEESSQDATDATDATTESAASEAEV